MTSERLPGPTHLLRGGERLPHGEDTASAVGAGRAEDWTRLDSDVFSGSLGRVAGRRARALGGLRLPRALPDDALPPYADDPDPGRSGRAARLRDDPEAPRGMLGHRHARVRVRAPALLPHRHGLGRDEALPHRADPAPEVARAARGALRRAAREASAERLIACAASGGPVAPRALAMELLGNRFTPADLLDALRLLDDPQPDVRASARAQALRVVGDRKVVQGPHGDAIRALARANEERIVTWWTARGQRVRDRKNRERGTACGV
ncbi:hypothetical protein [Streptomyces roseolus]|uniref:hypothetical protein n=1 Tax=Streptomyces roseolus TaxID=67358 RepID=UPI0016799CBD|nr:hypothetical protein [Streptomyces roseolus]GGR43863.1 hypothetical protein GCM10010282_40900 [Streptomyces roseolus]